MKVTFYIAMIAILFTATSCTKKTPTDPVASENAPTTENTPASENAPASITQDGSEFAHRKPFKFTVTTDIDINDDDEDMNDEPDDDEDMNDAPKDNHIIEEQDLDEIKIFVNINDEGGKYPVKYDLDCDSDGTYEFMGLTTPNQYCTYKRDTGKHQIALRGDIPAMILCASQDDNCNTDDNKNCSFLPRRDDASYIGKSVIAIDDWGDIAWKSMFAFAMSCRGLRDIPNNPPNLKDVTDMSMMFCGASLFNQPLEKWDVANVTNMSWMFSKASSFNQPLEKWDVANVTDMAFMFEDAKSFNQPLEKWNVSNVTDMVGMFMDATSFSHYPKSWVVPEGQSDNMFIGTKVEKVAKKKPLITEKR